MSVPARAVFVSYGLGDSEAARLIAGSLKAAGIEVGFDLNELCGADAWDHEIRKQVRDCRLFTPTISGAMFACQSRLTSVCHDRTLENET